MLHLKLYVVLRLHKILHVPKISYMVVITVITEQTLIKWAVSKFLKHCDITRTVSWTCPVYVNSLRMLAA